MTYGLIWEDLELLGIHDKLRDNVEKINYRLH